MVSFAHMIHQRITITERLLAIDTLVSENMALHLDKGAFPHLPINISIKVFEKGFIELARLPHINISSTKNTTQSNPSN